MGDLWELAQSEYTFSLILHARAFFGAEKASALRRDLAGASDQHRPNHFNDCPLCLAEN